MTSYVSTCQSPPGGTRYFKSHRTRRQSKNRPIETIEFFIQMWDKGRHQQGKMRRVIGFFSLSYHPTHLIEKARQLVEQSQGVDPDDGFVDPTGPDVAGRW